MADAAKAQLARDVCAASAVFAACPHRRRSPRKPPFVDWYLVLRITDEASDDTIRRRYRHLALQLHPDKNKHAKAEVAFKIVSEAYKCLTDAARRRTFDVDRALSFCTTCHERSSLPTSTTQRSSTGDKRSTAQSSAPRVRRRAAQALREVQNRLQDECRVIDSCLRMNGGGRRRQSFPLFDPSDQARFPDYPHGRARVFDGGWTELWRFTDVGVDRSWRRRGGGGSFESPVYQIRTECSSARTNRSW